MPGIKTVPDHSMYRPLPGEETKGRGQREKNYEMAIAMGFPEEVARRMFLVPEMRAADNDPRQSHGQFETGQRRQR